MAGMIDRRSFATLLGASTVSLPSLARGATRSDSRTLALPRPNQLAFQDMEVGTFFHYSIDTYGSQHGMLSPDQFDPTDLDAEQWVLAAKSMGARFAVLTARHEQGFCLWPTATTDYSIRNSPYKSGRGDIVGEFVAACRKHGLKPGLYTPPWIDDNWDRRFGHVDIAPGNGRIDKYDDSAVFAKVVRKETAQITELMTRYGALTFVWCDHFGRSDALDAVYHGGRLRQLYAILGSLAHRLQPDCLYFGPDVEHVGNERALAPIPLWNPVDPIDGPFSIGDTFKWDKPNVGRPWGSAYRPRLAPTTDAMSSGGWMWTGPRTVAPWADQLTAYYQTVGRGSGVIINLTPDPSGRVPQNLVVAASRFGDRIGNMFGHPLGMVSGAGPVLTITFDRPRRIDHLVAMEDLTAGQKVAAYRIDAQSGDADWNLLTSGTTIGHKRIERIDPVTATAVRLTIIDALKSTVAIRRFAAYGTSA